MSRILLILRTLRYVKPVQILNRLWRKLPCGGTSFEALPVRDFAHLAAFPRIGDVWDGADAFTFLNETHQIRTAGDWNSPEFQKLWLYNLHYFDSLRQVTSCNPCRLLDRWIDENPVGAGNGWEPYPTSLRVVNWIKYAHFESDEYVRCEKFRTSLAIQVRRLEKRLEYHLLANHLLANAKALVFAGKYFDGQEAERWLKKGMDIYRRELPEQTCADGVNFERSAMYHSIILEDVLDCYNITREDIFRFFAEKMLAGLKLLVGPDGKIVKFNDATDGIALSAAKLEEYARELEISSCASLTSGKDSASPLGEVSSLLSGTSGFVRMEKGPYVVLAKFGEIGPSYQPGHAHADTGSFELWKAGRKIIGDTGCSTYVPGPIRNYERSTAAHNTVVVDGQNSSEVWAAHRVARRAKTLTQRHGGTEGEVVYRDFRGFEIRRKLDVTEVGLRGEDEICGSGEHVVEVRWHLPPGVGKDELEIVCPGELIWEPCQFAAGWNVRRAGQCAIWRKRAKLPVRLEWSVRFHDRAAFC